MSKLTIDDAKSWHMREAIHYNGGKVFFAYLHRCVEQPRLSRYDRYERKGRSVASTWRVDGIDQPSFAEAVAALNNPPVFTADELSFLATIPCDYDPDIDIRKTMNLHISEAVRNKGAVEWASGRCRLTPSGRLALSGASSHSEAEGGER